ncbi:MAG: hypothetical protein BWZ03_00063 [bacterium ADurb.BinA186]|nr:MAG: hypothetical protein BWZ03_00063 [bacterium ADurb.BinA186]
MKYVVVNIGCIECGVSSDIVGCFETKEEAESTSQKLNENKDARWRNGGQNSYETFELKNEINPEYKAFL